MDEWGWCTRGRTQVLREAYIFHKEAREVGKEPVAVMVAITAKWLEAD